jgi:SNF2 family DNA or RNA helicase
VVVHYDRWWNQAREDQATDRVHRLGQSKGVQVIKLITRGTVEEKIDALIARKAQLAEDVIRADDPSLVKQFTVEELQELLAD